ncbi:hypothetical protein AB0M20_18600 [Actinoplanes sp. NPDC051633]|uniref:hypothetical protein n=1 Tax=Actinoplanes sp. NPDC051633 TaxID=3155670 RepID=UPI00343867EC
MFRKAVVVLLVATLLPLSSCGVRSKRGDRHDKNASGNSSGSGSENSGIGGNPAGGAQTVQVNKSATVYGLTVNLVSVSYDPSVEASGFGGDDSPLTAEVAIENIAKSGVSGDVGFTIKFEDAGFTGGLKPKMSSLAAGDNTKATVNFQVDPGAQVGDLKSGVVLLGDSNEVQAEIPLNETGKVVDLAPKPLIDKAVTRKTGDGTVRFNECALRADYPNKHEQVEKDFRLIVCYLDTQNDSKYNLVLVSEDKFKIRLPDDSSQSADQFIGYNSPRGKKTHDVEAAWKIRWPEGGSPGRYRLEVQLLDEGAVHKLTLNVPA